MHSWTAFNLVYLFTTLRVRYSQNNLVMIASICIFRCDVSVMHVPLNERHVLVLNDNLFCINCSQIDICILLTDKW